MEMRDIRSGVVILLFSLLPCAGPTAAAPRETTCAQTPHAHDGVMSSEGWRDDIEAAIRQFYAALQKDDPSSFRECVAPDFLAFDDRVRYSAESLVESRRLAHARGEKFEQKIESGPVKFVNNYVAHIHEPRFD